MSKRGVDAVLRTLQENNKAESRKRNPTM
jgi:hypothetical protein